MGMALIVGNGTYLPTFSILGIPHSCMPFFSAGSVWDWGGGGGGGLLVRVYPANPKTRAKRKGF
jgi:hypothetical protein